MRTTETKLVEETAVTIECDVCGNDARIAPRRCIICKRDLCRSCSIRGDRALCDELVPPQYCMDCWKFGEQYRLQEDLLELDCEGKVGTLEKMWHKSALAAYEEAHHEND